MADGVGDIEELLASVQPSPEVDDGDSIEAVVLPGSAASAVAAVEDELLPPLAQQRAARPALVATHAVRRRSNKQEEAEEEEAVTPPVPVTVDAGLDGDSKGDEGGNEDSGVQAVVPGTQRVWVRTFGCSHNVSDSEYMQVLHTRGGVHIVTAPNWSSHTLSLPHRAFSSRMATHWWRIASERVQMCGASMARL